MVNLFLLIIKCGRVLTLIFTCAQNLEFRQLTNSYIQDISSLNSKLFHLNVQNCRNVKFQQLTITAPAQSLNTDGIHVGRSIGINITGAAIRTGDDCVSLGDGNEHITIQKVTCGPGHGISVGSLGKYNNEQPVKGVTVRTCTFTNTMFGVRIKTWPGSPNGVASDMFFEDLVMNNVGTPVLIDQQYCPYGKCLAKVNNIPHENIVDNCRIWPLEFYWCGLRSLICVFI